MAADDDSPRRCAHCPAPREAACPFELPIGDKLRGFHRLLST